ncbi:uncharacterized protein B0H64DRAFT_436349 [Chaetomium fimeti]|uniref:Uncharacterized protein n=1 Tax=Chaetomium fimeti TaxID=1854472 RepID=A0AAE0H6Q7_9PEZI|nr:hypothetical protein B0H64DRAFT_436349 [Chaetomium fimeti]
MSSPSKSPAPPPLVGNLGVHVREGRDEQELDPTSTRYQIVEAIVHLALTLLETREGRRSLTEVATAIIQERKAYAAAGRRRPQGHIYEDSLANMPIWIDTFLRRMRRNFPPVLIGRTDGEASAAKRDWGTDMNAYQAGHDAGVLWVKDSIISNMVYVRQQPRDIAGDSYILYKFQMVISVAHEIVHFLTGFLTGTMRPHTPPRVTAKPYGNPYGDTTRSGEAGRYWEHDFLGGFLEMWSLPDDPLDVRQPGVPFLFLSGKLGEATGREISMAYIDEFLNKRKVLLSYPHVHSNAAHHEEPTAAVGTPGNQRAARRSGVPCGWSGGLAGTRSSS